MSILEEIERYAREIELYVKGVRSGALSGFIIDIRYV